MPRLSPISRRILVVATLLSLVPFLLRSRLEAATHAHVTFRSEDVYYVPAPGALSLLSIGYRRALADLIWVESLVYFGEQVARRGQMKYLTRRADAILALDPDFREAYRWIAILVVYNTGAITLSDIEESNRYLERGARRFPRDGEFVYLLAFNYAIEMPAFVEDAELKKRWRRRAAELFAKAASLPGAPGDAALMAAEMTSRTSGTAVTIARLKSLLSITTEDRVREQLLARLARLTSEAEAQAQDADRRELLESWHRDYPYLPPSLFVLVGPNLQRAVTARPAEPDGPPTDDEATSP